jgi:hypothetical protein
VVENLSPLMSSIIEDDADGSEVRYKGSLVKLMDWDNRQLVSCLPGRRISNIENIAGILGEHVGADGTNFLMNDVAYGARTRKMYPLLPTSIVRGEYARADAAGTSNLDTNMTGTHHSNLW